MVSFGFSAFLKLICMNERPQRTEIKNRLVGRGDGGYDFHRGMKLLGRQLAKRTASLDDLLERADLFGNPAERKAAKAALERLSIWLHSQTPHHVSFPPQTFCSPGGYFKVTFSPDFGVSVAGKISAIHIWNTATPLIEERITKLALEMFAEPYSNVEPAPEDLCVLNLRNGRLIPLSEGGFPAGSGLALASRIDRVFESVEEELSRRDEKSRSDIRPGSPPPR